MFQAISNTEMKYELIINGFLYALIISLVLIFVDRALEKSGFFISRNFIIATSVISFFTYFYFYEKSFVLYIASIFSVLVYVLYLSIKENPEKVIHRRFVEVVSHLFRTPLTGVKWVIENIIEKRDMIPEEERVNLLQSARDGVNKILILVEVLTEIPETRNNFSSVAQAITFREMLDNVLVNYRKKIDQKGITLIIEPSGQLPYVTVDAKRVEYAIEVLLDNAVEYTPKGGHIKISIKAGDKGVYFDIIDSGIGLSFQDKNNLFREFYRGKESILNKPDGTGLCLFAAKKIINKHGGRIWGESKGRSRGSSFHIFLPL